MPASKQVAPPGNIFVNVCLVFIALATFALYLFIITCEENVYFSYDFARTQAQDFKVSAHSHLALNKQKYTKNESTNPLEYRYLQSDRIMDLTQLVHDFPTVHDDIEALVNEKHSFVANKRAFPQLV